MVLGVTAAMPDPASGQLTDRGVSLELATHRAATLSEVRYDLSFNVPRQRDRPVTGSVVLHFQRTGDAPLILDFADPARVRGLTANGREAAWLAADGHVVVPAEALVVGANELAIEFVAGDGPLNRHDDFLYTLFVPARAHEAFPSFDQPDLKARFNLELVVPADWAAVANGEVVQRQARGQNVAYTFLETEPLSTYLFSFVAGRFQVEEAQRDGRTMRLFHRETDRENVERNLPAIFDLHAKALEWLEDYTRIPYPFGKFDFVAIPSFQYNGMEHPGAILYRASSLFLDESATRAQELGRASLIAHETAHMWFGDLVTMTWFDDVWMKEVFANFMAAKIVNPSFPDIDHSLRFFLAHYPAAYAVDRTAGANPIRQELENLADAGSLYGAIIYQKAPIVMRQLERLTGEAAFREAVRRYLAAHAFGNASWTDLVAVLDEATPLDVPAWSRVWIDEPGRPSIRVTRGPHDVSLHQEDPRGRGLVWEQASTVRALDQDAWVDRPAVLGADPVRVDLPERTLAAGGPVLPNGAGLGYGLFWLDDATRRVLLASLQHLPDPLARAVAWVDLHELMVEGAVEPSAMLRLAAAVIAVEDDELVAQEVLGTLPRLFWQWVPPEVRQREARALEELLWRRMEEVPTSSRKAAHFNAWRAIATTPHALERMERIWRGDLLIQDLPLAEQDFTTLALQLAVRDVTGADRILDQQAGRIENPDRRERFDFVRRAVDPDAGVRDRFFASLADAQNRRREEWVVTAVQYLNHPLRAPESVRYLRPALEMLKEIQETGDIFFPARWLDASLAGHDSPAAAAVVRDFIARQEGYPPRLMGKLLQSSDPLFRVAALRASLTLPRSPDQDSADSPAGSFADVAVADLVSAARACADLSSWATLRCS
jgi:aminopeptidase N